MKIFKEQSIKNKLIGIIISITSLTLLIGFTFVIVNDIKSFKQDLRNNMIMNAKLIAQYCVAPLAFDQQKGTEEVLAKLDAIPYVTNAYVFDENNELYASFDRYNEKAVPDLEQKEEISGFHGDFLHIFQPIIYQEDTYGTIYIRASVVPLTNKIKSYILTTFILLILLVLLSFLLASRFQKIISEPILELGNVTEKISREANYSVRVQKHGPDEIADLYEQFNKMLEQIQIREMERDRAALALRESEKRLQAILDNTTALVYLKDTDGRYILTNQRFKTLFDIPDGKIIGKTDFQIFPEDFAKEFRKNDIKVLEVNKPINIEEIVPLDGDTHTYISVKFPLYKADGSVYAVCGISTDITERKQMEEELKNTRNYLKNVFNSLPSMLVSVTPEGIITQWNTAAENYTGISTNRALSQNLWDVAPFLKNYQKNLEEVIITQQPQELHRERMFNTENRFFNISIYPLVYNGSDGAVIRVDDITELERKDAQLRQAQKMETVGNLAGGLAHDFNNVLGGITGTISLMKYLLEEEKIDLEEMQNSVDIIEMASNRAADMVQQLLTLSRRHDLSFAPVDLNTSVKHVVKICENTFDKSIRIKTNYCDEDAMIKADPNQIEQVLLNLCVNASHAMTIMRNEDESQGGILTISIEKIKADSHFCASHPQARKSAEYWILRVRDTGVGMEPETLNKIFDPFFTQKKRYNGTGLGLAMVFNIVEEHKGFIDVYSEVGIGSTFNIFLPVLKKSKEAKKEKTEKVEIPKGSGLILVIDDEEIMRNTAENILKECGYDVILAKDGEEAIKIYKEIHDEIQAVLLDMAMPRLSGKTTYVQMKKINPDVNIILTSGFKQDKRVKEVMKMGVSGFIQKPYTMRDLAIKIKKVMG